ncbi:MAG: hypothetical protein LC802_08505 [Acidobacteria bacterium]|nr:hypothetical protein [Acidobacteriota bacterium]
MKDRVGLRRIVKGRSRASVALFVFILALALAPFPVSHARRLQPQQAGGRPQQPAHQRRARL